MIYVRREEIYNKIKDILGSEYKENEYENYTKYHLNEKMTYIDCMFLEQNYKNVIESEKSKLDYEKIEQVVMFVSFALREDNLKPDEKKNDSEEKKILKSKVRENVLEKDIGIFPNLKKIILLYSKETEHLYKKIKENPKYTKYLIIGETTDKLSVNALSLKIKNILDEQKGNSKNAIIDMTTGMKVTAISFYKVALETGIVAYTWTELQLNTYNTVSDDNYEETDIYDRVPLSKIDVIIEPYKENSKIYDYIDRAIKSYNFSDVANYYEQLGNEPLKLFYDGLSQVFSFDIFAGIEPDDFYNSLRKFLSENSKKLKKFSQEKDNIGDFVEQLIKILYLFGEIDIDSEEMKKVFKLFKIEDVYLYDFKEYKNDGGEFSMEELKKRVFIFFRIKYFCGKFHSEKERDFYYYKICKEIKEEFEIDIKEKYDENKSLKELLGKFYDDLIVDMKGLDPVKSLLIKEKKAFYYENSILNIIKYNLQINTDKEKSLKLSNARGDTIIKKLLHQEEKSIEGKRLVELLIENYDEAEKVKEIGEKLKVPLKRLRDKIKEYNSNIKRVAMERGISIEEDVVCYERIDLNKSSIYPYKVYINPKIFDI
ncbi:hypothetical protein M2092_002160 [Fusobacterium sp. PH5-44]